METLNTRREIVENFYRLRRTLGYLGLCLPIVLFLGGLPFGRREPSISDYYHTLLGDFYVDILTAIGVFLICYNGYRREGQDRVSDNIVTTLIGIAALFVAFIPNRGTLNMSNDPVALGQHLIGVTTSDYLHHLAAGVFMGTMAYMCRYRFARTAKPGKRWIYVNCSRVITAMLVATIIAAALRKVGSETQSAFVIKHQLVFWFEAIGVWAFSAAWLTKGRVERKLLQKDVLAPSA